MFKRKDYQKQNRPPHERLFEVCCKKAGPSVWAIGAGTLPNGDFQWEVYVEDPKALRKIPKQFEGCKVHAILCEKPPPPASEQ